MESYQAIAEGLLRVNHALEAEIQRKNEALRFYAGNFPDDGLGNWQERVCEDEGETARKALT